MSVLVVRFTGGLPWQEAETDGLNDRDACTPTEPMSPVWILGATVPPKPMSPSLDPAQEPRPSPADPDSIPGLGGGGQAASSLITPACLPSAFHGPWEAGLWFLLLGAWVQLLAPQVLGFS